MKIMLNNMYHLDFNENQGENDAMSNEDHKFLEIMNSGVAFTDGHYQLPLPFRNSDVTMPINKVQAIRKAQSLKKKLKNNEHFRQDYIKFIETLMIENYARKVDFINNSLGNVNA